MKENSPLLGRTRNFRREQPFPQKPNERADQKDRTNDDNGSCRQGTTSQPEVKLANKGTSKLLTAECIQNRSETFVIPDNDWQDFRSETSLVDTIFGRRGSIVRSEHSIVQPEEKFNYTMTETRKEHRSLAIASSKRTSEELSVHVELLQESSTEVSTALQHVEHGKFFLMTTFYVGNLLLEEGNKLFELD